MKLILTSILLLLTTNLFAQEVQVAKIGELVKFEAPVEAESYKWFADINTTDFLSYNNGKNAVFSGRSPGTYKFFVAYYAKNVIDLKVYVVTIAGPPKEPQGTSDLSQWIPYWLGSMDLPKDQAELLAKAFDETALKIKADMKPEDIITLMTKETKVALDGDIEKWIPFFQKIQTVCTNKAKEGKLTTPKEHIDLFVEISKGIRIYK